MDPKNEPKTTRWNSCSLEGALSKEESDFFSWKIISENLIGGFQPNPSEKYDVVKLDWISPVKI